MEPNTQGTTAFLRVFKPHKEVALGVFSTRGGSWTSEPTLGINRRSRVWLPAILTRSIYQTEQTTWSESVCLLFCLRDTKLGRAWSGIPREGTIVREGLEVPPPRAAVTRVRGDTWEMRWDYGKEASIGACLVSGVEFRLLSV